MVQTCVRLCETATDRHDLCSDTQWPWQAVPELGVAEGSLLSLPSQLHPQCVNVVVSTLGREGRPQPC